MSEDLKSQVLSLTDLIEYQQDAIVSKTLVSSKAGTVTLFAFDKGQMLSEHTAPFDALVTLVDGESEITINNQEFHLKTGDMIIMPANESHAVKAKKKFKMILTMIRSE